MASPGQKSGHADTLWQSLTNTHVVHIVVTRGKGRSEVVIEVLTTDEKPAKQPSVQTVKVTPTKATSA